MPQKIEIMKGKPTKKAAPAKKAVAKKPAAKKATAKPAKKQYGDRMQLPPIPDSLVQKIRTSKPPERVYSPGINPSSYPEFDAQAALARIGEAKRKALPTNPNWPKLPPIPDSLMQGVKGYKKGGKVNKRKTKK